MSAIPIAILPVIAVIAVMAQPVKDPGACDGCWYDAPTGNCAECGEQICTR